MRLRSLAVLYLFALATLSAAAQAGDAAAVLQYCGAPDHEHQGVSPVTNKMERDLTYGNVILHFLPAENGWRFLSGWSSHLPLTRSMVESRMPCFQQAMASSASDPASLQMQVDPSIRSQMQQQPDGNFGIPHLRLILFLAVMVLLSYFLLPGRYRRVPSLAVEGMRQRRKPSVERALRD